MPVSECTLDAPRALRRVRFEGFNDVTLGVLFVRGEAQSGMPEVALRRGLGIGLALIDLGPWEDAPAPAPVAEVAAPAEEPTAPTPEAPAPRVIPQPIQPAPVGNRSGRR